MSDKFVELTHKDKGHERENSRLHHCEKNGIPFIVVRQHGKLADIHWDYISFSPELDHGLFESESKLREVVTQICNEHGTEHSSIMFSPGVVTFQNFNSSCAQKVAGQLYDAVQKITGPLLSASGVNT